MVSFLSKGVHLEEKTLNRSHCASGATLQIGFLQYTQQCFFYLPNNDSGALSFALRKVYACKQSEGIRSEMKLFKHWTPNFTELIT